MKFMGKRRLLVWIPVAAAIVCAALVWPIVFSSKGGGGPSGRRAARDRLAVLRGGDLLEALLDPSQPAMAGIISLARQKGISPALQELRRYHQALPRQPYLRPLPEWSVAAEVRMHANEIMQKGYQVGTYAPFPVQPPIDWAADPFTDRSWRFDLHSWKFLDLPIRLSRAEDGAPYAKYARDVALDWARRHLTGSSSADFAWYDMAVGARASILAVILDDALRDPTLSDDDLLVLLKAARVHAIELADERTLARQSNHGLFQMGGLLALAVAVPELRDAAKDRKYAERTLVDMLSQQFTSEGIHKEHSPGYHVMVTTYLGRLLKTGWLADNAFLNALYPRAARDAIWMVHPDGKLANVGDSELAIIEDRLIRPDDPRIEYVLTEGTRGTMPPTTFEVFKQSGYAMFRSPWDAASWTNASYLFFTAAFHSRTHKHADDFSFEWSELGMRLVQDSGMFAYWKNDARRDYMESTRAHNTVEIDETDYSRVIHDVFGSAITDGGQADGLYYVRADLYRKRTFNTNHRRLLVFDPGQWVVVIDRLRPPDKPSAKPPAKALPEHTFTQWFHFDPSLQMKPDGGGVASLIGDTGKRLLVMPLQDVPGQTQVVVRGQEKPRLQGWISLAKTTITSNDAVGFMQKGKDATFVTLLCVGSPGRQIARGTIVTDPAGDSWEVRWSVDGKTAGFRYNAGEKAQALRRIE